MVFNWQDAAAWLAVGVAAGYLIQQSWRSLRGRRTAGCGGCSGCPSSSSIPPLVSLDVSPPSAGRKSR